MIDIEKLAKENGFIPHEADDGECYADIKSLAKFAEAYAAEKQRQQEPVAKINAQWSCPDSLGKKHRERYVQFKNGIIPQEGVELFTYPPDAAKVLEDKEREIAEFKSQANELKSLLIDARDDVAAQLDAYQELLPYKQHRYDAQKNTLDEIDKAISKTPAQSLQEHDN